MERETRTIQAPSGKEVVMKTYLTPRELREIKKIFVNLVQQAHRPGESVKLVGVGDAQEQAENKLIELSVASYDGSAENVLNRLLDGNPQEGNAGDYDFVLEKTNELSAPLQTAK